MTTMLSQRALAAVSPAATLLLGLLLAPLLPGPPLLESLSLQAQEAPLDVSDFEGADEWPLYEAGDLSADTRPLSNLRAIYDFNVSPPNGEPQALTMTMDVDKVSFQGEPALWIEWLSDGEAGNPQGTATLDAILVDRATFRPVLRIAGSPGDRTWAGTYNVTLTKPDEVVHLALGDDGTMDRKVLEEATNPVDFATYPFLFPFIELEEGRSFRLMNIGSRADLSPVPLFVRVAGRTRYVDAQGNAHDAWEVRVLTNRRNALITFWVTEEAPFFYGWHYRFVETGRTLVKMDYRHHFVLDEPERPGSTR